MEFLNDDTAFSPRDKSSRKRHAADHKSNSSSCSSSPPPPPPPIELRLRVLPPPPVNRKDETPEQRIEREWQTVKRREWKKSSPPTSPPHPHFILPQQSTDTLHHFVQPLPHSILRLTHCTIRLTHSATDTSVESASFDSQQLFNAAIAALPIDTPLSVKGRVVGLSAEIHGLLDEVHIGFTLTLHDVDDTTDAARSVVAGTSKKQRGTTADMSGRSNSADSPSSAFSPQFAHLDNESGHMTTSIRLLPSLTLTTLMHTADGWQKKAMTAHMYDERGVEVSTIESVDGSNTITLPAHFPLRIADVQSQHRQRVLSAHRNVNKKPIEALCGDDSLLNSFLALCPTVHLTSIAMLYPPPAMPDYLTAVELRCESASDMQLRGFHVVRPQLHFRLLGEVVGEWNTTVRGQSVATLTVAGVEAPIECCAGVMFKEEGPKSDHSLQMTGDHLNVMRLADILAASCVPPTPLPLSSFTTLPSTLDSILARQLPWLALCVPPTECCIDSEQQQQEAAANSAWNSVHSYYSLRDHSVREVRYQNFVLRLVNPLSNTSSSSSTPTSHVLLDTVLYRATNEWITFRLRPFVQFSTHWSNAMKHNDVSISGLPSFAQLLQLINVPIEQVPSALLDRVQLSGRRDIDVKLVVHTSTSAASCIVGTVHCGPSRRDGLMFFRRLGPAAASLKGSDIQSADVAAVDEIGQSPINCWLKLQCRALLDSAVFPLLATLTAGRCIEPVYQYVLCETEGGMEVTDEQAAVIEAAYQQHFYHNREFPLIVPLKARPTNGVIALQTHLPSGYFELPVTALTLLALPTVPDPASMTLVESISTSSSASSSLLVDIAEGSVELFRLCVDYLDINSLLYGLIPAVHSLHSVTAALTSSTYGRRVLLSRYSAWSDAAMWSAELLREWRRDGFDKETAEVRERYKDNREVENISKMCDNQCEVHWAAIIDLQRRVNRFLIRVMLQRKEDILPQLYERPQARIRSRPVQAAFRPGTVRPVYTTVPDAAMEVLLCVPPFHSLPAEMWCYNFTSTHPCTVHHNQNTSPHHVTFAGFMRWEMQTLWSLYMGPVYVYENEYTAGRGCEVDVSELQAVVQGRAVRQMYIDDVNQLPVVHGGYYVQQMFAPTLSACFREEGITLLIAATRDMYRRVAERRMKATVSGEKVDLSSEVDVIDEKAVLADVEEGVPMSDRDGSLLEYVVPLMNTLLASLHESS